jgi:hypothetical protein
VPPTSGSAGVPRFFRLLLDLGGFNDRQLDLKCVFIIKMHTQSSLNSFVFDPWASGAAVQAARV